MEGFRVNIISWDTGGLGTDIDVLTSVFEKPKSQNVHFTSPDKRLAGQIRWPIRCLHLAGKSEVKGTEAVVEAWSRHPEWPELIVIRDASCYGSGDWRRPDLKKLPNVRYLTEHVSRNELREIQNFCEIHVQPSQAEGYGHVIGEAMSCGAVVITTDAAPMNELVTQDRGVLVRVERTEPMARSIKNFVCISDLEEKIQRVLDMPSEDRATLGRNARAWYESQQARFELCMRTLVSPQ